MMTVAYVNPLLQALATGKALPLPCIVIPLNKLAVIGFDTGDEECKVRMQCGNGVERIKTGKSVTCPLISERI